MLNKALDIAYKAHLGQTDKAGAPYISPYEGGITLSNRR